MPFAAVLDANVLVPARLRDVLLSLGEVAVYSPRWNSSLLAEVERHLPDSMTRAGRAHLVGQMTLAFPDACVDVPPGVHVEVPAIVNTKDRHVLAAALVSTAEVVVSEDRAFQREVEESRCGVEVQNADTFLTFAIDAHPAAACRALTDMVRRRWLRPEEVVDDFEIQARLARWARKHVGDNTAGRIASKEFGDSR